MELMLLRVYQRQVVLQCKFLLTAAAEVDANLIKCNVQGTFYAIQNLLNAGANISKALWGQNGRLSAERKPLRDSIGIANDSPLRKVTMRNNFEHFDERLDRWWKKSKTHNFADLNIGPKNMIGGMEEIGMFRQFDPKTTDMYFWGQQFNVKALIDEVQKYLPKLEEEANKPHWEK